MSEIDDAVQREKEKELTLLREFFRTVAKLTLNHDVWHDRATVSPALLGDALEKVNPEWYKQAV